MKRCEDFTVTKYMFALAGGLDTWEAFSALDNASTWYCMVESTKFGLLDH
jgi:hypothetical protein